MALLSSMCSIFSSNNLNLVKGDGKDSNLRRPWRAAVSRRLFFLLSVSHVMRVTSRKTITLAMKDLTGMPIGINHVRVAFFVSV